jgi:hypothetical protein
MQGPWIDFDKLGGTFRNCRTVGRFTESLESFYVKFVDMCQFM